MDKKDLTKALAGMSVAALVAGASVGMTACGEKGGGQDAVKKESKTSCGEGSCGGKKDKKDEKDKKKEGKTSCGEGSCGGKK
jgi:radical SAM modification target selenobiotic family peptide